MKRSFIVAASVGLVTVLMSSTNVQAQSHGGSHVGGHGGSGHGKNGYGSTARVNPGGPQNVTTAGGRQPGTTKQHPGAQKNQSVQKKQNTTLSHDNRPSFGLDDPKGISTGISTVVGAVSNSSVGRQLGNAGTSTYNTVANAIPSGGSSGVSFGGATGAARRPSVQQILGTTAPPKVTSIEPSKLPTITTNPGNTRIPLQVSRPTSFPSISSVPSLANRPPNLPSSRTPLKNTGQTLQNPQPWSQVGQPILLPNPITVSQGARERGGAWWDSHIRDPWVNAVDTPGELLKKGQQAAANADAKNADGASRIPDVNTGDKYTNQQTVQVSQSQYGANAIAVSAPNGGSVGYPINPAMEGKQVTVTMYVVGDTSKVNLALSTDKGSVVASSPSTKDTVINVPINGQLVPVHEVQFNVNVPSDGKGWGGLNSTGNFDATIQIQPGAQIDILLETAKRSSAAPK